MAAFDHHAPAGLFSLASSLDQYAEAGIDPAFDAGMEELERQFSQLKTKLSKYGLGGSLALCSPHGELASKPAGQPVDFREAVEDASTTFDQLREAACGQRAPSPSTSRRLR